MDNTAFYDLSCGMFVLGALHDGKPTGCTVNTVTQVASNPPLLAVSVNHQNFTNTCMKQTGRVTVSVLERDAPVDLIKGFGFRSGREADKFDQVPYTAAPSGLPRLSEHLCAWFDCKVKTSLELSTHTLFILEVVDSGRPGAAGPMTYADYRQAGTGPVPSSAPLFAEPVSAVSAPEPDRYVCTLCQYEYDGGQGPFEALPDDWKCPLCGVGREFFQRA